jgi:hypothetical protein
MTMARLRPDDERAGVVVEVTDRLRHRGIVVGPSDGPADLSDLLSAVEQFESAVEAHGGDLMVDDLKSVQPDDRHFVLPRRDHAELIRAYIGRIRAATSGLRKHPRHLDS